MPCSKVYALTSIAPQPRDRDYQHACIRSWREAALAVHSFNHPSEIADLARAFDVEFVPVSETSHVEFGRHLVPINFMLDWAAARDAPALLINADLELRLAPWQLERMRWLSDGGLCFLVRHNHRGEPSQATVEPHGIDAFLLHGRHAALFPPSFLSMGQPFWDYWLPQVFAANGLPLTTPQAAVAFHRDHPPGWSWAGWHRCAIEFGRLTGLLGPDGDSAACHALAAAVREHVRRSARVLPGSPPAIRDWVRQRFTTPEPKTFLELGAHCGTDTAWLAALPGVSLHAFEPDPRNIPPSLPNVRVQRAAVSDRDGYAPFVLSNEGWGREWTYSSSLRQPKQHLQRYPVSFGPTIEVRTITLDGYCATEGIENVDFIWADIQGAEADMIRGALATLTRTRYLYTEYSDEELYQGQASLQEILAMLPAFRVLELWPDDVLLENTRLGR
jgi:FkbM family methyltransferase